MEFVDDDFKTREEVLEELKNLRTRLQEVDDARRVISKEKNNQAHLHAEEEIRWAKERESERASAGEILHFEKMEHLHSEKELGRTREQLRDVSFKLLQAEEAERKRIAQEIHDGVGQHWVIVKHRVETILKHLGKEITAPLEDILPLIQVGIEETRRIQMNLRPTLLDDLGILAAISWFCREFQKANPVVHIETKINIQENDVATPVKTVIYRIMQEAFNNISKHSKANLVNLTLQKEEDKIEFIIQDDGQGFDLNAMHFLRSSEKGLGLAGMKERTFFSGGSMSIESTQGIGTTIRASWPLSA